MGKTFKRNSEYQQNTFNNKARRNGQVRLEQHISMPVKFESKITRCGKRGFVNEIDAKIALASTQGRKNSRREECRSYLCPECSHYHLTSKPQRKPRYNTSFNKSK